MTQSAEVLPSWILAALDAPPRYADLAALRKRVQDEPFRVLSRLVPEIEAKAKQLGGDEQWRTNVVRTLVRTWLEHEPEITLRTKKASKAQADRAASVAKAAEKLMRALASARLGLDACRMEGIEPVLLGPGLDELDIAAAEPVVAALLEVARKRSTTESRHGGYAPSVATLTARLDVATASLGFMLSEAAAADFFELADLSAKRTYTEEAIRKARARTIRA